MPEHVARGFVVSLDSYIAATIASAARSVVSVVASSWAGKTNATSDYEVAS